MSTNIHLSPNPNPNPVPQPKKRKRRPNAFADILREWEAVLAAVEDHAGTLAPIDPHRAALTDSLEKARQAKALQDSHRASRQKTTQTLKAILVEGKDRAIRLRGAIRAEMGPTTEQLSQFGIHPLRRKPLRHQPDSVPVPTQQPEAPAAKAVQEVE